MSFIAFLCDNFKNVPNLVGLKMNPDPDTSPEGESVPVPLQLTYAFVLSLYIIM